MSDGLTERFDLINNDYKNTCNYWEYKDHPNKTDKLECWPIFQNYLCEVPAACIDNGTDYCSNRDSAFYNLLAA